MRDREADRRRVQAQLAVEDVAWNWVNATGDIAPLLETQSELADLIVLNTAPADHEMSDMRATVSEIVVRIAVAEQWQLQSGNIAVLQH